MPYTIEPTGGEDGPVLGFEPDSGGRPERFEVYVDDALGGVVERREDGAWLVRDVGQLGFESIALPGGLDGDALADATLAAVGDWVDEHRRDLYRPI